MTLFADDPNRNWAESLIEGDVHHVPDEIDEDALPEPGEDETDAPDEPEEDDEIDVFIARKLAIDAFYTEATSGDYDHLLETAVDTVNIE